MLGTIRLHFVDADNNSLETLEVSDSIAVEELQNDIFQECGINGEESWEFVSERSKQAVNTRFSFRDMGAKEGDVIRIQPGARYIGRYKIVRQIGVGGMGIVYEGEDPNLDRRVAIKVINEEFAMNGQTMERFSREARAVARLSGEEHIVNVYDFVQGPGTKNPYFVMEYVDGYPLSDLIEQRNGLPIENVAQILTGVGAALDAAHKRGIIHRDIKPSNILLQPDADNAGRWIPKLADFGLVRISEETSDLTQSGAIIGTPRYMSPEQIEARPLSEQSDIYSLGIVVYEMLTGQRPFSEGTTTKQLVDHLKTPPPPPQQFRSDIPTAVAQVVLKALAKNPGDRYKSAGEFAREFAKAMHLEEPEERERGFKWPKVRSSKKLGAFMAGTALLIVAGLLAWFLFFKSPNVEKLLNEGQNNLSTEQYDEALIIFDEILVMEPENTAAISGKNKAIAGQLFQEAQILLQNSKHEDALSIIEEALVLDPQNDTIQTEALQLAASLEQNNQLISARKLYHGILAIDPENEHVIAALERLQKIAFISTRDGDAEIYIMASDGSGQKNLTNSPSDDYWPRWSPDGSKIAFHSYELGHETTKAGAEIYLMDADGTNWIRLTRDEHSNKFADWSPEGDKLVFASDREGDYEIFTMNVDGSQITRLTQNPGLDYFPMWSPTGQEIVFMSDRDGNNEIYLLPLDGSPPINLTNDPADDSMPAWSPDGSQIVFTSNRSGQPEVWLMNKDGVNSVRLTDIGGQEPRWSKDGDRIVFFSVQDGDQEIYAIDSDGRNLTRLTNSAADDRDPSWVD